MPANRKPLKVELDLSRKLRIGQSGIHGMGIMAATRFLPGDTVLTFYGELLDRRQYGDWIFDINAQFGKHWVQVSLDAYLDPWCMTRYVNHSCSPNCGVNKDIGLVALKKIEPKEEVTYDYAMTDWSDFRFACSCREPGCRGTVLGYRHLPEPKLQEYSGHVLPYLERAAARLLA